MSQENVDIVRAALDAWNGRDRAMADDPRSAVLTRCAAATQFSKFGFEDIPDAIDGAGAEAEEVMDLGNERVLVVATYRGRGRESEVDIDVRVSSVHWISGGVIRSVRDYANTREALEAAGLRE